MTQRRRIPFILLAAFAMVFALATSVLAAGELNIKCDDKTINPANIDTFEVVVKSSGTSLYATGMVDVEFDSDVFELAKIEFNTNIAPNNATYLAEDKENEIVDGEGGTTAEQAEQFMLEAKSRTEGTPVVVEPGKFRIDFGNDLAEQNFTANDGDVLFTLTFKVSNKNASGKSQITLVPVVSSYLDADGNPISENLEDGSITMGKVLYGDCNDDGKISKADSLLLKKHLAKWTVEINMKAADVNHDGKVSKADSLLLKKYLAKWSVDLGN